MTSYAREAVFVARRANRRYRSNELCDSPKEPQESHDFSYWLPLITGSSGDTNQRAVRRAASPMVLKMLSWPPPDEVLA